MIYLQKVKNTVQKAARVTKIIFATTITLAFGATMLWGVIGALNGKVSSTLAIESEYIGLYPQFASILETERFSTTGGCSPCGWYPDEGSHNTNSWVKFYCDGFGCTDRGGVCAERCEFGAGNLVAIQSHNFPGMPNDTLEYPEHCYDYQQDWYSTGGDWNSYVGHIMKRRGYSFDDPECQPPSPASCSNITGPEGTVQPGANLSYFGTINNGNPEVLQWKINGQNIAGANGINYSTTAPETSGTYEYWLSVNNDSVDACKKTITIEAPQENWSCESKYSNRDEEVLKPGDELTYFIKYSSQNLTSDLTLVDELPEGFTPDMDSITGGYNCALSSSVNNFSRLFCRVPRDSGTLSFKGIIDQNFTGNTIDNNAHIIYENNINYRDNCNTLTHQVAQPEVTCENKTADVEAVRINDIINYEIKATLVNTEANELVIIDDFDETKVTINPLQVSVTPGDGTKTSCIIENRNGNQVLNCSVKALVEGGFIKTATYTFKYSATVLDSAIQGMIENNVIETYAKKNGVTFTDVNPALRCNANVDIIEPIITCVDKVADKSEARIGEIINYTVSLNLQGTAVDRLAFIDNYNETDVEIIADSWKGDLTVDCEDNGDILECNAYSMLTDSTIVAKDAIQLGNYSFTYQARVKVNETKFTTNMITSASAIRRDVEFKNDETEENCSEEVLLKRNIPAIDCISKEAEKNHVDVGDHVEFIITYRNTGETTLQGFVMHDLLPVGMEFVSSENNYCIVPSAWVNAGTGQLVICNNEKTLQPGEEEDFKLTVEITSEAEVGKIITNKVTKLSSDDTAGNLDSCTEDIYVNLPEPIISVTKETIRPKDRTVILGDDAETPEDYVKYKIVVTNEGPTKLIIVPLKDIFSAHDYKFIEATPKETSVTTFNATTIVYWENLGELKVGESKEVTITLQALETYWDSVNENVLPNKVRVEDVIDENGVKANKDEDTDHVVILGSILGEEIEFTITKDLITESPTSKGNEVKFRIRVTNIGGKEIATIKFIDYYDTAYLTYNDFSNEISHRTDLYTVDAVNGQFIHDNLLYEKEALESGEYFEFEMWFIAENKNGETTNWAKAIVNDKEREDFAKVKIVAEILAKTGSNVLIPLAVGVALTLLLSKKVLVKKSDFVDATTDKERK